MKTLLYLRGKPGSGKITVARILEQQLGFKLFWFHDIKNAVYGIVREHRIPRLMDEITAPILNYLLERKENILYVRPSPDKETVENIRTLTGKDPEYRFVVILLEASYETLQERVQGRDDPFRITSKADLDSYLSERSMAEIPGEHIIQTDALDPTQTAAEIVRIIEALQ